MARKSSCFLSILSDFDSLDQSKEELNAQLALDAAVEFGIWPLMTAQEMTSAEPDPLGMVMFLSQFYQLLKDTAPPAGERKECYKRAQCRECCTKPIGCDVITSCSGSLSRSSDLRLALVTPAFLLSRLGLSPSRRRDTEVSSSSPSPSSPL